MKILFWMSILGYFICGRKATQWTEWRAEYANETDYIYRWSNRMVVWSKAVDECSKMGWRLAKILNVKEDTFIRNRLRRVKGATSWIGLKLKQGSTIDYQTGTWSDGSPFVYNSTGSADYAKWSVGEPRSAERMDTCVDLYDYQGGYMWDDYGCAYNRTVLCQVGVDELRNELINVHKMSSSAEDVDKVTDVTNEILQSTEISEQEATENLEAIDTIMSTYQGDDYHSSAPLLDITINSTSPGESLEFGSIDGPDALSLVLNTDLINEAFDIAGNNRTVLRIGSILYRSLTFFKVNASRYVETRSTTDNVTYMTHAIVPNPYMTFGENAVFRLPVKQAIGRSISSAIGNVSVKNLRNWLQVKSRNVCDETGAGAAFSDYSEDYRLKCVFWNTSENDWSDDGCMTELSSPRMSNASRCYDVTCKCNHMTHFTIVFDSSYVYAPKYLNYITITGSLISGTFLLFTCITILSLKHMRTDINKCIIFNISLNLLLFQIMFLVGIDRHAMPKTWCYATSYLLHTFTLTSWFWMLVESVYLMLALCLREHASSRVKKIMVACGVFAYGIPVTISSLTFSFSTSYLSPKYCWLCFTTVLQTVVAPIACILAVNLFVGTFAMYTMICASKVTNMVCNMTKVKRTIRRIVYLSFLLGLPWTFGLFMLLAQDPKTKEIFALIFTAFLTLQGLVIFIAFCATDDIFKNKLASITDSCAKHIYPSTFKGTSDFSNTSDTQNRTTETDRTVTSMFKRKSMRNFDDSTPIVDCKSESFNGTELTKKPTATDNKS